MHINELEKDETGTRKIEFIATGNSPAGIEFYSWDFVYDSEKCVRAEVLIDKDGTQTCSQKPGSYHIAVKAVDQDGLENTEAVKLTVNGEVKRG